MQQIAQKPLQIGSRSLLKLEKVKKNALGKSPSSGVLIVGYGIRPT